MDVAERLEEWDTSTVFGLDLKHYECAWLDVSPRLVKERDPFYSTHLLPFN